MFLSYNCREYVGYDDKTNKYSYRFKIVDSEFEETETGVAAGAPAAGGAGVTVAAAVAEVYQRRAYTDKQIAKQIFLCLQYVAKKFGSSLDQVITWSKQYNPEIWDKYGENIKMFLIFS